MRPSGRSFRHSIRPLLPWSNLGVQELRATALDQQPGDHEGQTHLTAGPLKSSTLPTARATDAWTVLIDNEQRNKLGRNQRVGLRRIQPNSIQEGPATVA